MAKAKKKPVKKKTARRAPRQEEGIPSPLDVAMMFLGWIKKVAGSAVSVPLREFKSDGNSDNNDGGGASRKVSTASRVSHHTRIYTDTPSNNTNTEAETVS